MKAAMTQTPRREFLKTAAAATAAATAGAALSACADTRAPRIVRITFSGLVLFVRRRGAGLDVLLPTVKNHAATFAHGGESVEIKHHHVTLSPLPGGDVDVFPAEKCSGVDRWMADINKIYPKRQLVPDPAQGGGTENNIHRLRGFLTLNGGRLEPVDTQTAEEPVWTFASGFFDTYSQILVRKVRWVGTVDSNVLTVARKRFPNGQSEDKQFQLEDLNDFVLSHDVVDENGQHSMNQHDLPFLFHFNAVYGAFQSAPVKAPPMSFSKCRLDQPNRVIVPQPYEDSLPLGKVKWKEKEILTASDPICPPVIYEP